MHVCLCVWADVLFRTAWCSSRGLATCTTGVGKRVRMKGGDLGREERIEVQGAEKEKKKKSLGHKQRATAQE